MDEPTEWVSNLVATHKKETGDVRICIDSRNLNKALMRPHHPMRTVEEVAAQMSGATIFSILDAKSSFWQVRLDDASSLCTTFTTPYGRPCAIIMDDIIIGGKDPDEHERNLKKVLDRARQVKLRLNPSKCKFGLNEVSYVGHTFTDKGLKADPKKIKAISEIPPPRGQASSSAFLRDGKLLGQVHSEPK